MRKCQPQRRGFQKTNDNEKILLGNVLELYVKETSLALHLLQEEHPQPISDVMAALSFLLALTNSAEIRIGESFHCQVDFSESIARNREEMQKRYDGLQNLQKALAFFGVTKDILISDNIEHSEMNCIIAICHAMMNEGIIHPVEPLKVGVMGIFHVFDARLLLRVEQVGELTYKLSNMFLNPCKNGKLGVDGPPCSVFIIMKEDDFENLDNIDYTALVEDLFSYTLNDEYSCAINQLLLRMLNAYDKTGNPDLIIACEEVSRKLFEYHTDDLSNLNYFQCVKRQRELSGEEMEQLYSMRLRQQPNLSIQLGIAILLENETDVRYHFSHLDSQNQDEFLSYPICNLSTYLAAQCKQRGSADKPNE